MRAPTALRVAQAVAQAGRRVDRAAGFVVFTSGQLGQKLAELAQHVARQAPGLPGLVVSGAGVLSDQGEIENDSAATGVVWRGGSVEPLAVDAPNAEELGESLARAISDRAGKASPTGIVFMRPDGVGPHVLEPLQDARGTRNVFGAGVVGSPGLAMVDASGEVHGGGAVGMLLRGLSPPLIRSSPACRLLSPLRRISAARGSMVLELDGQPALEILGELGAEASREQLVFAVLAAASEGDGPQELLLRGIQGVDPVRRGILVSDEVREGMHMGFGVRDASAARTHLESVTRELSRELCGAAPRFGLYLNCAGRGHALHQAFDVDTRILRERFPGTPLAGMNSSFEIAPCMGKPCLQLYTGVLALFTVPS